MKKVVEENEDFAFYIKMLPLKIHPAAYGKSKAIICQRSIRLLERAFDGRRVPEPACETTEVDDTVELAERLGITGTPTIVLPDGGVVPGYKDAGELAQLIEEAGLAVEAEQRRAEEAEAASGREGVIKAPDGEAGTEEGPAVAEEAEEEAVEEAAPEAGAEQAPAGEPGEKTEKQWWW
jgi:hypothetical protein